MVCWQLWAFDWYTDFFYGDSFWFSTCIGLNGDIYFWDSMNRGTRPQPAKTALIPGLAVEHWWNPEVCTVPGGLATLHVQPSLTEICYTVTSFNLFIRDLGHVISIFSCQKAHISNNMTAFGHPFLLSPLILRSWYNSRIYLMQVRCSVGKPRRNKR